MLENNQLEPLSMRDQKCIVDHILPYLNTIPSLTCPLHFGVLHKQTKSMCIQFPGSEKLKNQGIAGGYEGNLYFTVWYRFQDTEADAELYGSKVMYQISEFLDNANMYHTLPDLGDEMKCAKMEMVTLPSVECKLDSMLDCMAIFQCRVKHT